MAQICIILQCIFFYISTYIRTGISYNWNKKVFLTWKCDSSGIFWWRGPLVDRVCSRRRRWWKRKGNPVLAPPTYNPPSTSWSEDFLPSYHLVFLTSAENAISFIVAKILLVCQFLSFLSDPSPIIGYACHSLTDWLTDSLTHSCLVNLVPVNDAICLFLDDVSTAT